MNFTRISPYFVPGLALLVVFLVIFYAGFGQRPINFDEPGIFNAPYMFAQYNSVSYPVWYHRFSDSFETYYFHPPVYYTALGTIMKVVSVYYAEAVIPTLIFMISVWLIVSMRAPSFYKFSYLLSLFSLVVVYIVTSMANFGVRPDMVMALCWAAGLLAMEKSRLEGWSWPMMFLGSFLAVLASSLHYIGVFFMASVPVYCFFAYRELGWRQSKKVLAAAVGGGCLIGVPYLVLFIIPNFEQIINWLTRAEFSNEHGSNPFRIFWFKVSSNAARDLSWSPVEFFRVFPGLLMRWYVPIGLFAAAGLLMIRNTRTLAWAALPHMIFIYFIADKNQSTYIIPEYFFIFLLVFTGSLLTVQRLLRHIRLSNWERPVMFVLCVSFAGHMAGSAPHFQYAFKQIGKFQVHWMEVARAAGQRIIGTDAVVGENTAAFYISGARYWYPEGPMFLLPDERTFPPGQKTRRKKNRWHTGVLDEEKRLSAPTSIVGFTLNSPSWLLPKHLKAGGKKVDGNLAGYYADGKLNILGVVNTPANIGIMFFSTRKPDHARYFQINHYTRRISEFVESGQGDTIFGTYLCLTLKDIPEQKYFRFYHPFITYLEVDGKNPQILGVFRTPKRTFDKMTKVLSPDCYIKESHLGTVRSYSLVDFMKANPDFHKDISFFPNQQQAIEAKRATERN
ncbi:MAG: hypothetical protein HQ512_04320 [Rhodospirillales bacterium]|nr:hypothetical protein [Rhodospirillales bacterium]